MTDSAAAVIFGELHLEPGARREVRRVFVAAPVPGVHPVFDGGDIFIVFKT